MDIKRFAFAAALTGILIGSAQAAAAPKTTLVETTSVTTTSVATSVKAPSAKAPPTPPPRPDVPPAAPAKPADTATADNVVIASGTMTYRIKHIALTGTKLSDADLAVLLDAKSTASLEARLKTLTAASIEIPEIVADDATPGSRRHWSATKILFANVVSGRVGAGSANGVAFALTQGGETVEGSLGALQGTGLELPQIAHLFAFRTDDREAVLPVAATLAVEGLKLANASKGTSVAVAALEADAVAGRPLRADHAPPDATMPGTPGGSAAGPPGEHPPTLLEDAIHSFAVGALEARDLAAAHKDTASNGGFAAKRVFLKGFRDGQGTGGLREARLDEEDLHAAFGSIDFDDLSTVSATGPSSSGNGAKGSRFKGMVAAGQIAVATRPPPGETPTAPLAFKVEHLAVAGDAAAPGDLPNTLAVALDHLTFQTGDATATARTLGEIGYPSLDLSGALAARYDATARTLAIDKLSITGADMGTATLGLQLANVGGDLVSPKADVAQAAALALLVKSGDLRLEDAGFVGKALAWKARNDGLSVADERAADVDFFANTLPASIGGANAKVLGAAIGAFIAAPKTLQVTAASRNGLGAADLGLIASPDVLLDSLDLHASANGQATLVPDRDGTRR